MEGGIVTWTSFLLDREGGDSSASSDGRAKGNNEQKRYGYPMVKGEVDYRVSVLVAECTMLISVVSILWEKRVQCRYQ